MEELMGSRWKGHKKRRKRRVFEFEVKDMREVCKI